jgi:glutamate dehydrogenase/leucine dehydrogenase
VGPAEAAAVAAPLVLEGSNFGLSPEARALLASRGIALVPDVIASSSSAAMVGLQIQAAGGLTDAELWPRIEAAIDGAARGSLHTPARVAADTAPGLAARGMISSR